MDEKHRLEIEQAGMLSSRRAVLTTSLMTADFVALVRRMEALKQGQAVTRPFLTNSGSKPAGVASMTPIAVAPAGAQANGSNGGSGSKEPGRDHLRSCTIAQPNTRSKAAFSAESHSIGSLNRAAANPNLELLQRLAPRQV